jgi:hypothetical protein
MRAGWQSQTSNFGGSSNRLAVDDLDRLRAGLEICKQPCIYRHLERVGYWPFRQLPIGRDTEAGRPTPITAEY